MTVPSVKSAISEGQVATLRVLAQVLASRIDEASERETPALALQLRATLDEIRKLTPAVTVDDELDRIRASRYRREA